MACMFKGMALTSTSLAQRQPSNLTSLPASFWTHIRSESSMALSVLFVLLVPRLLIAIAFQLRSALLKMALPAIAWLNSALVAMASQLILAPYQSSTHDSLKAF